MWSEICLLVFILSLWSVNFIKSIKYYAVVYPYITSFQVFWYNPQPSLFRNSGLETEIQACWEWGTGTGFQTASAIYFLSTSGLPSQSLSVLLLRVAMQDASYKSAFESRPLTDLWCSKCPLGVSVYVLNLELSELLFPSPSVCS